MPFETSGFTDDSTTCSAKDLGVLQQLRRRMPTDTASQKRKVLGLITRKQRESFAFLRASSHSGEKNKKRIFVYVDLFREGVVTLEIMSSASNCD